MYFVHLQLIFLSSLKVFIAVCVTERDTTLLVKDYYDKRLFYPIQKNYDDET